MKMFARVDFCVSFSCIFFKMQASTLCKDVFLPMLDKFALFWPDQNGIDFYDTNTMKAGFDHLRWIWNISGEIQTNFIA